MTFPLLLSEFRDDTLVVRFMLEFPLVVTECILQHETWLSELTSRVDDEYIIEAGYDIVPNCCTLASPEQGHCFQGSHISLKKKFILLRL